MLHLGATFPEKGVEDEELSRMPVRRVLLGISYIPSTTSTTTALRCLLARLPARRRTLKSIPGALTVPGTVRESSSAVSVLRLCK